MYDLLFPTISKLIRMPLSAGVGTGAVERTVSGAR